MFDKYDTSGKLNLSPHGCIYIEDRCDTDGSWKVLDRIDNGIIVTNEPIHRDPDRCLIRKCLDFCNDAITPSRSFKYNFRTERDWIASAKIKFDSLMKSGKISHSSRIRYEHDMGSCFRSCTLYISNVWVY